MATYPSEAKVTDPDKVGTRRMPPRKTKVAAADETNPSVVKYGAQHGSESMGLGRDLGQALKTMQEHRKQFPDSPAKMRATYE